MRLATLLFFSFCFSISSVLSQTIDKTYNPIFESPSHVFNGVIVGDNELVAQGDIKYLAGAPISSVVKFTKEGAASTSFNSLNGINGQSYDMIAQADGKIILSGIFGDKNNQLKLLIRLNVDGSVDDTFKPRPNELANGMTDIGYLYSIAIQSNNKIIVGGSFKSFDKIERTGIARLNSDGTLDASFNATLNFDPHRIAVQVDDKILVFGSNKLIRLNANGSVDLSFTTVNFNSTVNSIGFQSDGRIVVAGLFSQVNGVSANKISRINTDGSLDNTFLWTTGFSVLDVQKIKVFSDNKIVAIGNLNSYVIRLKANGELDPDFQRGIGIEALAVGVSPNLNFVCTQTDGSVIVGGYFTSYKASPRLSLVRIKSNGDVDTGYAPRLSSTSGIEAVLPVPNGKLVVAGRFIFVNGQHTPGGIVKLNQDGTLDNTFNVSSINWSRGYIKTLGKYADGKILLGGNFLVTSPSLPGGFSNSLIRLTDQGLIDQSLNALTGITTQFDSEGVNDLIVQDDGKAIIGGFFTKVNGVDRKYLARLNSNGSVDMSFHSTGADYSHPVMTMNMNPGTGKIVLVHPSNIGETLPKVKIAKADGSLDTGFDITGKFDKTNVYAALFVSNEKLLLGGEFTSFSGHAVNNVVRITDQGAWDESFKGVISQPLVNSLLKTSTDKILAGNISSNETANALTIFNTDGVLFPAELKIAGSITKLASDGNGNYYLTGNSTLKVDDTFVSNGIVKLKADVNPVTPTGLTAKGLEKSIDLSWNNNATAASVFEIERSTSNNLNFKFHGLSKTTAFIDSVEVARGTPYHYRIRSASLNGNSTFSNEVSAGLLLVTGVESKSDFDIKVYPNPFTKIFILENPSGFRIEASLLNYAGREISRTFVAPGESTEIGDSLVVGLYFLRVEKQGNQSTIKLIKN
jgi:uncharacterized delta-60 repeat protein